MRALLLAVFALAALPVAGADLAACAGIAADAERLACYDSLAGRTPPLAAPAAVPAAAPAAATATSTAAPAASPAPAPGASPAVDATAGFGAEQLPVQTGEDKGLDLIESTLPGSFRGWNKDSVFELANGQVWRCIECRDVYYARDNPAVTIKRNFLGSYWLRIEGLNQQARVRRVK